MMSEETKRKISESLKRYYQTGKKKLESVESNIYNKGAKKLGKETIKSDSPYFEGTVEHYNYNLRKQFDPNKVERSLEYQRAADKERLAIETDKMRARQRLGLERSSPELTATEKLKNIPGIAKYQIEKAKSTIKSKAKNLKSKFKK